eukprot:5171005-Pyramimonas_sp.AAC.1
MASKPTPSQLPRPSKASLHGVLARPLPGELLVSGLVVLVDVRDLGHEGVVRVGVGEQRADAQQHLGY